MSSSSPSGPLCVPSYAVSQQISSNSGKSRAHWGKRTLAMAILCLAAVSGFAYPQVTAHFSGAVTTLGSGFTKPAAAAVDSSGNVFVTDYGNNTVKEILAAGGYTTINTLGSGFNGPVGVAIDGSGNIFVADSYNNAVKEILAAGGYTTINTLGSGFTQPAGVAVDGSGNVFVADSDNGAVKEILAAGGYTTVNTLGSGFTQPAGVAVDGSGSVFVTDWGNNLVKEILAAGGYTTVETLGRGFNNPLGLATDGRGNVFVADSGNQAVKELMTQGVNFGSAASGTSTPPTISLFFTFDSDGAIGTPAVLTQGATGLDFADAATADTCKARTVLKAHTCTLNVSFTPKFSGPRYGAATLKNSSGAVIATAYIYGTGTGPQVTFSPGTQSTLAWPWTAAATSSSPIPTTTR